eukprot:scaffold4729_cov19-Tisochrysis_lutea.AAC.1
MCASARADRLRGPGACSSSRRPPLLRGHAALACQGGPAGWSGPGWAHRTAPGYPLQQAGRDQMAGRPAAPTSSCVYWQRGARQAPGKIQLAWAHACAGLQRKGGKGYIPARAAELKEKICSALSIVPPACEHRLALIGCRGKGTGLQGASASLDAFRMFVCVQAEAGASINLHTVKYITQESLEAQ